MDIFEQVEQDPWLAVRLGKVRYFYMGQRVIWHSTYCGDLPARVLRPIVSSGYDKERWNWVTNLGLPQPPGFCWIEFGDESNTMTVDVDELTPV